MTIYIFGGSNTAAVGGWAEKFAIAKMRKTPTQNLALAAMNTLGALTRLMSNVTLQQDDVVVWANAINDGHCMTQYNYPEGVFADYIEAMIIHTRDAGARFIPVLLDSFDQVLFGKNPAYVAQIFELLRHYDLEILDLPQQFHTETGLNQFPRNNFLDPLHMLPHGELSEFTANLASELVDLRRGYPADKAPLFLKPGTSFEVHNVFREPNQRVRVSNFSLDAQNWIPPISMCPALPKHSRSRIEAVTLIADPVCGRLMMSVDAQSVPLSATHKFFGTHRAISLTTCVPLIASKEVSIDAGSEIKFTWDRTPTAIPVDAYFRADQKSALGEGSSAGVLSVLLRHSVPS